MLVSWIVFRERTYRIQNFLFLVNVLIQMELNKSLIITNHETKPSRCRKHYSDVHTGGSRDRAPTASRNVEKEFLSILLTPLRQPMAGTSTLQQNGANFPLFSPRHRVRDMSGMPGKCLGITKCGNTHISCQPEDQQWSVKIGIKNNTEWSIPSAKEIIERSANISISRHHCMFDIVSYWSLGCFITWQPLKQELMNCCKKLFITWRKVHRAQVTYRSKLCLDGLRDTLPIRQSRTAQTLISLTANAYTRPKGYIGGKTINVIKC